MPPKVKDANEAPQLHWTKPGNTLKIGLVGLPNVGKSTTFNVLTKCNVPAENYPFCTIDPHEAVVEVPDVRFDWLVEHFKPASAVHAVLRVWDIAGLVPNAHEGAGLGNAFLANIQSVDGIYHVVRAFDSEEVTHTEGSINPARDLDIIQKELIYKDIAYLDGRISDLEKKVKSNPRQTKQIQEEIVILKKADAILKENKAIRNASGWSAAEVEILQSYSLLTTKPVVYLVNMSPEDYVRQKNRFLKGIVTWVEENGGGPVIPYSAALEKECVENPANRTQILEKYGAKKCQLEKIIKTGYEHLDLIYFFTAGTDEVRAWTIQKGTKAPQAAGVIHTDFERGFISADVYKFADIKELGSEPAVKAGGKLAQKGKDYELCDGDVCHFKFNVTASGKK